MPSATEFRSRESSRLSKTTSRLLHPNIAIAKEMAFKEIPILDLSEARHENTKPAFLRQLRDALLNVGFLYIKNTGIDQETLDRVSEQGINFFELPEDDKLAIEMKNEPSFLGYSRVRFTSLARSKAMC